jgi:Zn-dependent membrane protease YugP
MGMMMYYVVAGLVFLFSYGVKKKLSSTYKRWSQVRNATDRPGAEIARIILDANRLQSVPVDAVPGKLTDHYDPRSKQLSLARDNFVAPSVAAMAIAAHECGHALQDADNYRPMELRSALVPVANAGARFGMPVAIVGSIMGSAVMVQIGILGYVGAILLTFLTLPVEFNASKRALAQLEGLDLVSVEGSEGTRQVLRAAAMTYVAGVASSAGYLVYLVFVFGRSLLGKPKPPPLKL